MCGARTHCAVALFSAAMLGSLPASAEPNEPLARAEKLMVGMRYPEANHALEEAWAVKGNDRATVIHILELQAISYASLHKDERSQALFKRLLAIDPGHTLSSDLSPRVKTPYYEAKTWVTEHGALRAEQVHEKGTPRLTVRVSSDTFQLAKGVRFHAHIGDASWKAFDAPLAEGLARCDLRGAAGRVQWWAEVLNEHEGILVMLGSETSPLGEEVSTAEFVAAPPPPPMPVPPPEASPAPEPLKVATTSQVQAPVPAVAQPASAGEVKAETGAEPRYRPGAYVLFATGVVAAGVGGVFGYLSSGAQARLSGVTFDSRGRAVGISQADAYAARDSAIRDAEIADALFIGGGALAATGVILWFAGGTVSASPSPGGVSISGTFW